jgi:putative transcriptional regulator
MLRYADEKTPFWLRYNQGAFIMIRNYLSRLLGERRMSQAELSRLTGIRPATINEIYHEIAVSYSVENLNKICEALNCSLNDLLEYIPDKKRTTGKDLIIESHGNRKNKNK